MPVHEVSMRVAAVDVSGVDVVFVVKSDGEKLGELHLSQGDLTWRARGSRKDRKCSWEQFDTWMRALR